MAIRAFQLDDEQRKRLFGRVKQCSSGFPKFNPYPAVARVLICLPFMSACVGSGSNSAEQSRDVMKRIAMIALVVAGGLAMIESAAAREPVRPGWTPSGSAVCPSNYEYSNGWCYSVLDDDDAGGGAYGNHRRYRREYYGEREGYGPHTLPAQWGYGSPVCPSGYDYVQIINGCVNLYDRGTVPAQWNYAGSAVCPGSYAYVRSINACVPVY